MKKIVALACSPNKEGNSDTLLDSFLKGLSPKKFEVEKVYVHEVPSHFFDHTHKVPDTKTEPELAKLCEKIQAADGLVLATPTYNFGVPAGLKNLIDRIGYFALDYQNINMVGQPTGQLGKLKVFSIVTGGTPTLARRFLFFCFPGFWLWIIFGYYGCWNHKTAYAGPLTFRDPAKNKPQLLKKFTQFGKTFAKKF